MAEQVWSSWKDPSQARKRRTPRWRQQWKVVVKFYFIIFRSIAEYLSYSSQRGYLARSLTLATPLLPMRVSALRIPRRFHLLALLLLSCSQDPGAATTPPSTGGTASGSAASGGDPTQSGGAGSGSTASGGNDSGGMGASATGGLPTGGTDAGGGSVGSGGLASGGEASGGGQNLDTLTISNLTVSPNPNMTISCFVSWTTETPANSEVQFGAADQLQFRIVDDELVVDHEVLVIGMHAEEDYLIRAVSTNATASGSADSSFTTGALPLAIPEGELGVSAGERSEPGWTLTNLAVGGGAQGVSSQNPAFVVMIDENARVVWYFVHGQTNDTRGDISTVLLANDHVLVGPGNEEPPREVDLSGEVVWTGPAQPGGFGAEPKMMHHASQLENGNIIVLRGDSTMEEIAPDLSTPWTWTLSDYVTQPMGNGDWCHSNSISVDEAEDAAFLSCRYLGIFKVQRSTQELLWHMGVAIDDPDSGEFTFLPPESKPNDIHEPEFEEGRLLVYDNQGYEAHGGNGSYHTRVLEFEVNESERSAELLWEFPGDFAVDAWYTEDWSTPFWGDADRLENGNILITAGARGDGTHTRIFEVTKDTGEVVWQMRWPDDVGSYRAERLSPPPLVEALP